MSIDWLESLQNARLWVFPSLLGGMAVWLVGADWRRRRRERQPIWHEARPRMAQIKGPKCLRRAVRAIARGDGGRAALALRRAPRTPDTAFVRGLLAEHAGSPREAVQHYRAALARDDRHGQAAYNLARLLTASGQAAEAIAAYQRAIAAGAGASAHFNLALLYFELHMDAQAHTHCAEAARLEPDAPDIRDNLR
ncbi:MAG TPA: tetratricopeptide repeat protein, partial [Oscillatoriaceae cyanobacterium]